MFIGFLVQSTQLLASSRLAIVYTESAFTPYLSIIDGVYLFHVASCNCGVGPHNIPIWPRLWKLFVVTRKRDYEPESARGQTVPEGNDGTN